ncbi:MAG: hypothetical protein EXR19_04170 [Chitinophagaceae bacterium]|nr:hypothetical protein [Chitinophagaceae bacterium]
MQLSFEQKKNMKAGVYTLLICIALSSLFIIMQWQQPAPTVIAPATAYMEVNLGNTTTGQGDIAPLSKEAPAPELGSSKSVKATAINKSVKINASGNDPNDEAIKSAKAKTNIKNLPLPPASKPKALMGKYAGGNGKGGNNQDSYNNEKDQGIAGGKGDQGVANGSINGKNYKGTGGPFVTKGDRRVTKAYSFNGDVEPATIYAEIEVNPTGVGRFVQIVKGSSSNDAKYKRAIVEYLTKISFNSSDHISNVTVKFKFENQ